MEWITDLFIPWGFAGIGQDMRGTEKSQGNFTLWHSDANDSRDLGDWIVQQDWSDGRIFTVGASADGLASLQTPMTNPSWLAGQYAIWCPAVAYDILCPNGAYKQKTVEDWLHGLTMPDPDVVNANIQTVHENEAQTDFWKQIELDDAYYAAVTWPSAFWAGWYDLFLLGNIQAFEGFQYKSAANVRGTSKIVIDPCGHCMQAADYFKQNTVMGRTAIGIFQLFELVGIDTHVPRENKAIKAVTFYVMSSNDDAGNAAGNYWTSVDAFPEFKPTNYYLSGDLTASTKPPAASAPASTTYKYDPNDPVPTIGGNNLPPEIGGTIPCGPLDQSPIDGRDDMVVFNVPVSSSELVLSGPINAELFVSSDMVDTDFMVRVSDVYNDEAGTVRILQDNAVRMRWREGGLNPVPMTNGEIYKIEMSLWNTSFVVAPGHNLRFVVQSANFPRFSVNNNNGILLADPAYPGPANVAQNTLYHSAQYPSKIILPIITGPKKMSLPEVHMLKMVNDLQAKYPHLTDEVLKKFEDGLTKRMKKK